MKLPLLLLLIFGSWALVARANPARHWRRAPSHGVFDVDVYAYNKPLMNLAGRQKRVEDALPMVDLLQQISQHSRRSTEPRSHYRKLEEEEEEVLLPMNGTINMQLMPLQMNSTVHARENLYSNEFHVQSIGAKKIVQLNTLTGDHERKPVVEEEVMTPKEEEQQEPLKVKLTLPELQENNGQDKVGTEDPEASASNAPVTAAPSGEGERESSLLTSVKKTMAPSGTIIDMASTGMQQLVGAGDTGTKKKNQDETRVRTKSRPKTRRKHKPTGAKASNETDTKMTVATPPAPYAAPPLKSNPLLTANPGPLELETQSPEISTHRPATAKAKGKGKGKGKNKRRKDSLMEEEIETTTNWWQILPYTEIRKFLNTIYDTIADDADDERGTDDV
ncbi:hypothetical protein KR084_009079 [Drosophila pseudotakahashii]|nr:hypothetical protein KR084_009079 [Drosophila pseudotakahashii]